MAHARLVGLVRLSRWQEHVIFTVPLTLLGINMAAYNRANVVLDWHIIPVTLANLLAVAFAFMVNDVEDAPDDARDPARASRNPVSRGELSSAEGWLASWIVGAGALWLYAWAGPHVFGLGALTLVLAYFYSWRRVRLKAWPVVDVIAHVLMLSALLFLVGYFAYHDAPGRVWLAAVGVALVSAYGQLYNQLRDYDMDRAARLHNTASLLGPANTRRLMYASLGLAGLCLAITVGFGLWPGWLVLIPLGMTPVPILLRPHTDLRGTEAVDLSGRSQLGFIIIANVTMGVWLGVNILS